VLYSGEATVAYTDFKINAVNDAIAAHLVGLAEVPLAVSPAMCPVLEQKNPGGPTLCTMLLCFWLVNVYRVFCGCKRLPASRPELQHR
jgi:hypothetical protein